MQDELCGRIVGEFVLRELLAEGGHGRVYRCEQQKLGREAVVKVLRQQLRSHDRCLQRFLREAKLASQLDHPYAAHIYAFGAEPDGLTWIAMEFVHGVGLDCWLRNRGPMTLPQFVLFFEHVAEVVETAHRQGIVHRDLKPSNVMVIERVGRLLPKLLDFGVAKLLDAEILPESAPDTDERQPAIENEDLPDERQPAIENENVPDEVLEESGRVGPATKTDKYSSPRCGGRSRLTPDNVTVGTPPYIAPEVWIRGARAAGPASDLYALGAVGFEVLTGRSPFQGSSATEFAELHCYGDVPRLGGRFLPELDAVFQRALAKRAQDRWGSALELAGALRQASRIDASWADLPRIETSVRDEWLADAPQPLAELVAVLDSARNAHQAYVAIQELTRNLLRYLLAVALATRAQVRDGQADRALLKLVRALQGRELSTEERVRLLRLLVRPLASQRSSYPIPKLIDLVTPDPDGADGLDPILVLCSTIEQPSAEDGVRSRLIRLIPALTKLLRATTFVLDYMLVVPRDEAVENWTGLRRQDRAIDMEVEGELVKGHPMLLCDYERVCVDLWPLVQVVPPTDNAEPELFVFDGHGRDGALLIAAPSGLHRDDSLAWDWVATHVVAEIETKMRMHDQIRVAAHQWQNRGRPNALLWRGEVLVDLERWLRSAIGPAALGDPDASFVAACCRAGWRARWFRRSVVALAVAAISAGLHCQAVRDARQEARMAQQLMDAKITQAEVEAGRQALLHDERSEAQQHLAEAYRRGDHSSEVKFMLARSLQPLMAEQARFTSTSGRMWWAAFSPDSHRIVTTDDKAAQVWDAQTNQLLFTLPHGDTVYRAVYSGDGTRLVTAGGDGAVRIWDAAGGTLLRELRQQRHDGEQPRYFVVAMSPDGRVVAAIDAMGKVGHVWDAGTGTPLASLQNDASEWPSLAFSADGRWLAASGGDDVRVFDTKTWAHVRTLAGPRVRSLSFDPTGPRLATGTAGGDAAIWAIPSGARAQHLRDVGAPILAVAFSPDGQFVATGGGDGTAQIWDGRSGALRNQISATRSKSKILSIEFDPTAKLVVAAGDGGGVVVAETLGMPLTVLDMPRGIVRTAHFDSTSQRVVGASWEGTARVWDTTSPYRRWSSPPIAADCGLASSLEPDQRFIAIGCRDHNIRVLDTARDRLLAELPNVMPVASDPTSALVAVSAVGDRAAIARGNTVEVYELPSRRLVRVVRHGAAVNAVAFAPAGHDLVSGATDGSLRVTRDGCEPIALSTSAGGIDAVAFLVDGRAVASDAHGRLRIYDPDRGAVLANFELPTRVILLRPSPDGLRLVTIPSYTGMAAPPLLWDLERYGLVAQLDGHVGRVFSARYVDGGHAIVTVGGDGVGRLWNGQTGRLLSAYRSASRFLADAVITSDGSMVIAGGSDGLLWFWDRKTTRPLWTLQAHSSQVVGLHFEDNELVTRGSAGDVSRWSFPKPEKVIEAALPTR